MGFLRELPGNSYTRAPAVRLNEHVRPKYNEGTLKQTTTTESAWLGGVFHGSIRFSLHSYSFRRRTLIWSFVAPGSD